MRTLKVKPLALFKIVRIERMTMIRCMTKWIDSCQSTFIVLKSKINYCVMYFYLASSMLDWYYPARALGLLLADGAPTVGWGKNLWRIGWFFYENAVARKWIVEKSIPRCKMDPLSEGFKGVNGLLSNIFICIFISARLTWKSTNQMHNRLEIWTFCLNWLLQQSI